MRIVLKEHLERVLELIKAIDELCIPSQQLADRYSQLLKEVYDASVELLPKNRQLGPVAELILAGMDDGSIWEELQTKNRPLLRYVNKVSTRLLRSAEKPDTGNHDNMTDSHDNLHEVRDDDDEPIDQEDDDFDDGDINDIADYDDADEDDDDDDGEIIDNDEDEDEDGEESGDDANDAELDETDELDEMEAWLDREDNMEAKRSYKLEKMKGRAERNQEFEDDDNDDDDDSGAEPDDLLFVQQTMYALGEEEEEDEEADEEDGAAGYKYADFFVDEKSNHNRKKQAGVAKKEKKQLRRSIRDEVSDDEDDGDENDFDEDENDDDFDDSNARDDYESSDDDKHAHSESKPSKTKGLQQRSRLSSQISELEEDLLAAKPWELRGEVRAADRPENSFLSLTADIERSSKPAPLVTQDFTSSLEDMIRRRVKEGAFNDVQQKVEAKPTAAAAEDVSQEKSKVGLGELYAEEFLARSLNAQPQAVTKRLEADREEVKSLFHKISRQLDALSHFHFTPKPVVAEVNISPLPVSSLLLEEVAPSLSFTSTAQSLVAPEEVSQKKRGKAASLMSDSELTSLDKQRMRRAAKAHKKAHKSDSGSSQPLQSGTKKGGKFVDHALDDQLKRDSRVIMTNSDGSFSKKARVEHGLHEADANSSISYGKSSSFFSNLQEQTKQQIKSTIEGGTTASAKSSKDAKKLSSSSRSLKL